MRHFLFGKLFLLLDHEQWSPVDPMSFAHYVNGYFCIIVAFKSHIREHVGLWAFWEHVIASTDSRSGMSVVVFRTALPIGGLPCLKTFNVFIAFF